MTTIQSAPDPRPPGQRDAVAASVRVRLFEILADGVKVRLGEDGNVHLGAGVPLWHLHWLQRHAHEVRQLLREETVQ